MTDTTKPDQSDWPVEQRDWPSGALIQETHSYQLLAKDAEGRWVPWGAAKEDRDEMTRVQADCARRFPEEKRRILRYTLQIWVDEVEGDGEGETSRDELLARNEQITACLIGEEETAE